MTKAIYWFRQDLRCYDNPALTLSCNNHDQIIPLFIKEDDLMSTVGSAQRWWLHHSLRSLQKELSKQGLPLVFRTGKPLNVLLELIKQYQIDTVYWNRCYESSQIARDKNIKAVLTEQGVHVVSCNGRLLNEPWSIKNKKESWFKVFTPYWRQCLQQMNSPNPYVITNWPKAVENVMSEELDSWKLLPTGVNWADKFSQFWQPGEAGALQQLNHFIHDNLNDYEQRRDYPSYNATSKLAPFLHFGEISPWQIWRAIAAVKQEQMHNVSSIERFQTELGWREFSYYLLYHFPELPNQEFNEKFKQFPWQYDQEALQCWQRGQTGYPIIDASMRELWETGYMHNRMRMVVASFLTKDLFVDWREGIAWFHDTLLDADIANNAFNWQWVAGCGADAAPYFRVFNPVLQSQKFDPNGYYIKRWVPELATVPIKWLHEPWRAPKHELPITLGKDYPHPIVDHSKARDLALIYYQQLKSAT